ncbi:MAG: hypothetical protein C3F06_05370 [Candidatus Methanoperedenaceae archaeon]|nr:MAG: hypothetical protein C3F06_05370 [Candidatus Methanoperedenaceae archaeon]
MVLDILEDLFEGDDDEKTKRRGNRDRDKEDHFENDDDEYNSEIRDRDEDPGKKRGFFDRITELFE